MDERYRILNIFFTYSEFEVVPGVLVDLFELPLQRKGEFCHCYHVTHVSGDVITQLQPGSCHVRRGDCLYLLDALELRLLQDLWRQKTTDDNLCLSFVTK